MDTVYIRGLQIDTVIGVNDWERDIRQTVVLDLEMAVDVVAPGASDDIGDTLDYFAVSTRLTQLVQSSEFLLIEALAEAVSSTVMREFAVPWLRLRVSKPGAISNASDVGVIIERGER